MRYNHVKLEKPLPTLNQINENGKRFYETAHGRKYPSITTVLSQYNIKSIMEWRARVGTEEANRIASKAATRGTKLHKICEDYINNEIPVFKTPLERELFSSIKPHLHRINNVYAQELRMYSDHLRVAGTVDCIGEFDGKLSVIDFKTSNYEKQKEKIENYFMQCSGYAVMFEELFNIPVSQIVVVIAVEDGSPQVFVERRDNYIEDLIALRDQYEKKNGIAP